MNKPISLVGKFFNTVASWGQRSLLYLPLLLMADLGYGQILVDYTSTSSRSEVEGILSFAETEYEFEQAPTIDYDIDRDILALGITVPVGRSAHFLGQFGFILDSERQNNYCDGDGFMIGGGLNSSFIHKRNFTISGFAFFNYIKESFDCPLNVDVDSTVKDFHFGPIAAIKLNPSVSLYGALDLAVMSRGDWEYSGGGSNDFERDNLMTLRLGAKGRFEGMQGRFELALVGEDSFTFSLSTPM